MISLSVKPVDGKAQAYGKTVDELQSDIVITENSISGRLHNVNDYTGFNPSQTEEQSGHFLALDVAADKGAEVTFELVGGTKGAFSLTPDDMQVICRIRDKDSQSVKITSDYKEEHTEKVYSLKELILE